MKPIVLDAFSSNGCFECFDFEDPRFLLLRTRRGFFGQSNTDLIFGGVQHVDLPWSLFGVKVHRPRDEFAIEIEKRYANAAYISDYKGEWTFILESDERIYHVIASGLWIHVNTLPSEESSLKYVDEIIRGGDGPYHDNHVKEYYKVR
jgi:hypothetical protein